VANEPDEAVERHVFSKRGPSTEYVPPDINEDDAVPVTPFQIIRRGEDTVDREDRVTFADFSPAVLPSDAGEGVEAEPIPKGESAPEPASSPVLPSTPAKLARTAPPPASKVDGKSSLSESSSQTSSTNPKPG
jgi:hypothetical protein